MSATIKDTDFDTIENRRTIRGTLDGWAYDTTTASLLWRYEPSTNRERSFYGQALWQNVYGKFFLHTYGQWDRLCRIERDPKRCIQATQERYPELVEELFGRLHEEGQGEAYKAVEP